MDSGLMMTFLHACHPHPQDEKSLREKTLLIIDSCLKYAAEDIQTKSSGIIIEVIPKGATNQLHPLDIGVKAEFEQIVQEKWENRAESGKEYGKFSQILNTSCLPKRPRQTVKTQIRLLLKKQSYRDLRCLLFRQHFVNSRSKNPYFI